MCLAIWTHFWSEVGEGDRTKTTVLGWKSTGLLIK